MAGGFLQLVGGLYVLFNTIVGGLAIAAYYNGYNTLDGLLRFIVRVAPAIEEQHIIIAIVVFVWAVVSIPGFMMISNGEMNEMQGRALDNDRKSADRQGDKLDELARQIAESNRLLRQIADK